MNYNLLIEQVDFITIISHRMNDENDYEFLFKVFADQELHLGPYNHHVEYVSTENDFLVYNVWIKESVPFSYYELVFSEFSDEMNENEGRIVTEIYNYCRRKEIKILYCFKHKLNPSMLFSNYLGNQIHKLCNENFQEQIDMVDYFKKIYPTYKVISNDDHTSDDLDYDLDKISSMLKLMNKDDIVYVYTTENNVFYERDIILFERRMNNIFTDINERRIIMRNRKQISLSEVVSRTQDFIKIIDRDFYNTKISIDTLVLATNNKLAKESSLKILPKHLIREISRWL